MDQEIKIRIVEIQRVLHLETQEYFLDVSVEIFVGEGEDENILSKQKHGYSTSIDGETLKSEIDKILEGYIRDERQKEENKKNDEDQKHVDELREKYVGVEIKAKQ